MYVCYVCLSVHQVELEYQDPHSQERLHGAKVQHMWSQSLYILCGLLEGKFINIGEIDPLNRRLSHVSRPDTLVQGIVLFRTVVQGARGTGNGRWPKVLR